MSVTATVLFWFAWSLISAWALRHFYYSFSEEKLKRLRFAALSFEAGMLLLFFLSWLPDGTTGLDLLAQGHPGAWVLIVLLGFVVIAGAGGGTFLLKAAAVCHFLATIGFFALMVFLMGETVRLMSSMMAPIVIALLGLVNIVVLLLVWQQLQLRAGSR